MKQTFKKGDMVRLTGNRDPNIATVDAAQAGGVMLHTQLGGYFAWNEADLDLVVPLNMVLHCPSCGHQHIDKVESEVRGGDICVDWANPPHRSHKCKACGTIWRPADVPTNGVQSVVTRGKVDTWPRARELRGEWFAMDTGKEPSITVGIPMPSGVWREPQKTGASMGNLAAEPVGGWKLGDVADPRAYDHDLDEGTPA